VPPKADPRDWDRFFRPGAPRRGGPLRALANLVFICVAVGILGGAAFFAWNFGRERARESAAANLSLIETENAGVMATRTARAFDTATAQAAASLVTGTPTATFEPIIGRGRVTNGGNLRKEPVVDPATVMSQICVGDQVDILEERTLNDGARWYRIRISTTAEDCTPERAKVGSVGWANASLLNRQAP
jgi:hypothetical protein